MNRPTAATTTHDYGAPLGDGSKMVERLLDEAGVPASTVRLGEYALNSSRRQGAALMDTSALNAAEKAKVKNSKQCQVIALTNAP